MPLRVGVTNGGDEFFIALGRHGSVDDGFIAHGAGGVIASRTVLLATGIVDVVPRMAHLREAIADGCVRLCPICDAYVRRD